MIKKLSLLTMLTFITALFSACSDDFYDRNDSEENPEGLHIYVPTPALTRAQSQASGKELSLKSLTLLAYPKDGGDFQAVQLLDHPNASTTITVKGRYTDYTLTSFPNGTYRFYLVANVFNGKSEDFLQAYNDESKLKEEMVTYTGNFLSFAGQSNQTTYLPMCAAPNDFWDGTDATKNYGSGVDVTGGATLYADMTFGVAKVTVCFEDEAGGNLGLSAASLLNYANKFPAVAQTSLSGITASTSALSAGTVANLASDNTTGVTGSYKNNLKQYTFYVPENVNITAATTLKVTPNRTGADAVDIVLGERDADGEVIAKSLYRGHHYDYLVSPKGSILLSVQRWAPEPLEAEINAPFELVILEDKPYIDVLASGEEKGVRFSTDADPERVKVVSPQIEITVGGNKKTVDFYKGWIEDGRAMVSINTEIPLSQLQTIANSTTETAKYNYYHIQANNLMKRVDIGSFKAEPVFTVYPDEVTIYVNEYFTSNDNTGSATIRFNTNLEGVKCNITSAEWEYAEPGVSNSKYQVVNSTTDGSTVFKYDRGTNGNAPNGVDILQLGGLLDGQKFWTEKKEMVVTYEVIGAPADWTESQKKKTVTVKVRPFNSRYIIHFKTSNGQEWDKPHIYVYQCLEVPAGEVNGGKTIGYKDGNNSNAALEYCFTSDIAFKGFTGYGGTYSMNFATASYSDGFVWNSDLAVKNNVSNPDQEGKKYKYVKMNTHHYEALTKNGRKCSSERCGSEYLQADRLWPGIVMYKETKGDAAGWWTYELSGAATPGKALIMFTNDHAWDSFTTWRFPANDKVGVPLFDFEDKEGWFLLAQGSNNEDYVNNRFYDDNPLDLSKKKNVTIYYKKPSGVSDVYLYGWGGIQEMNLVKMKPYPDDSGWVYLTIKETQIKKMKLLKADSWGNNDSNVILGECSIGSKDEYFFSGSSTSETSQRPSGK